MSFYVEFIKGLNGSHLLRNGGLDIRFNMMLLLLLLLLLLSFKTLAFLFLPWNVILRGIYNALKSSTLTGKFRGKNIVLIQWCFSSSFSPSSSFSSSSSSSSFFFFYFFSSSSSSFSSWFWGIFFSIIRFWHAPCHDPAGNRTTRRPPGHRKETQTAVVWSCLLFIRSGQNHLERPSKRGEKRQGRQRKRWEDNIREWTGLGFAKSQRAVEKRKKNGGNWLRNHLWCPDDLCGLWIDDNDDDDYYDDECSTKYRSWMFWWPVLHWLVHAMLRLRHAASAGIFFFFLAIHHALMYVTLLNIFRTVFASVWESVYTELLSPGEC